MDRILGVHGEALRVAVRAPPERGKANAALLEVIARGLGLPRSSVSLVSGETSREKRVRVEGVAEGELLRRLSAVLGGAGGRPLEGRR